MVVGASATMVSTMRIFHQSSEMSRPGAKPGLQTAPMVCDFDCSGSSVGLEPEVKAIGVCEFGVFTGTRPWPSWRKVLASAPMSAAQLARVVELLLEEPKFVSQGSVKNEKVCEPPPYRSAMVGARKPSAAVARTSSESIGRHSMPILLLLVRP